MIMGGFIKDLDSLEEHNSRDLFGYTEQASALSDYLSSLPKNASILALIGAYGVGKSFLLNLVRQKLAKKKQGHWFHFEAWRYTDRKDLWRAFITEFGEDVAKAVHKYKTARYPKKILNDLRGLWQGTEHMVLGMIIGTIILSTTLLLIFREASFLETATFATSFITLMIVVVKLYTQDPLRKQEGYETSLREIFKALNKKEYQKLYVVLEDIDRSGEQGFLFMETLSLFLRRYCPDSNSNLSIKFIVPMSNHVFQESRYHASLMKTINYCYTFNVHQLNVKKFVQQVFVTEFANEKMQGYVEKVFNIMFASKRNHSPDLRIWKTILRGANAKYMYLKTEKKFKIDPLICIIVEMTKYYTIDGKYGSIYEKTWFERIVSRGVIENAELVALLIYSSQGVALDGQLNRHLQTISKIYVDSDSTSPSLEDSGFDIEKHPSLTSTVRIHQCYFDDFKN